MAQYPPIMKDLPAFLYGGDYNPEQWLHQKEIWKKDMELAQGAGINTLTVGVFSWSALEPREGEYRFEWLDEVMDLLAGHGMKAVLATPSGARPRWMAEKYPEVLRVNGARQRALFGGRHNHCLTSPVYREKVRAINTLLAERYKDHPALGMWHISNEFGGECHCPLCQQAFRSWLKDRYGTIENLNLKWWNSFWSHTYDSFDQIESPSPLGEMGVHGLNLAWKRFTTQQFCDFYAWETEPLKRITPGVPCTANLMQTYEGINYFALGRLLDRSSWDNYPAWTNDRRDADVAARTAFYHDLMRGVCGPKPFMMMESSPTAVNWHAVNRLRTPGLLMLQGLQAVAHGSDSVQYFQFRSGRGGSEKFHGAVVTHAGTDQTRVYREVAQVGRRLQGIAPVLGSAAENKIAVIYDWENRWALRDAQFGINSEEKGYEDAVVAHHVAIAAGGFGVDVIDEACELTGYRIVAGPMTYMLRPGFAEKVDAFVRQGGVYVSTYCSGWVDEEDLTFLGGFPGPLRAVTGVWDEETDALDPTQHNHFTWRGKAYETCDYSAVVHPESAQALAVYENGFYAGAPALTVNAFGQGRCYYIAARTRDDFLRDFYAYIAGQAGVAPLLPGLPFGVSCTQRVGDQGTFLFVMNALPESNAVCLPPCVAVDTGARVEGQYELKPYEVLVLKREGEAR
ncbi:MAG: beta-galactosidase [Clostridia bacterium]|nr:beta-galactosidase [Clostridia bacterium]